MVRRARHPARHALTRGGGAPALAVLALLAAAATAPARAGLPRLCDMAPVREAADHDRLLRFGAEVRRALEDAGAPVALIARSGLDLDRIGHRYSHAGLVTPEPGAGGLASWRVRQLYYACDEGRARLFDQGVAGFVAGLDDPASGRIALVVPAAPLDEALARSARDTALGLALLGPSYSANAHAHATRHQNCNQWVAELTAAAAPVPEGADAPAPVADRAAAQRRLTELGYAPSVVEVPAPLRWLAPLSPWLRHDDHPEEDLRAGRYRVSMPASLEAWVRQLAPASRRIELCLARGQVVVRHGWTPLDADCTPGEGDEVRPLAP